MTTLYDCTAKVKPARRFGQGLLAYIPQHTFSPYTAAEEAEAREMFAREEQSGLDAQRIERRRIQIQAAESAFMGFYENGLATF